MSTEAQLFTLPGRDEPDVWVYAANIEYAGEPSRVSIRVPSHLVAGYSMRDMDSPEWLRLLAATLMAAADRKETSNVG